MGPGRVLTRYKASPNDKTGERRSPGTYPQPAVLLPPSLPPNHLLTNRTLLGNSLLFYTPKLPISNLSVTIQGPSCLVLSALLCFTGSTSRSYSNCLKTRQDWPPHFPWPSLFLNLVSVFTADGALTHRSLWLPLAFTSSNTPFLTEPHRLQAS